MISLNAVLRTPFLLLLAYPAWAQNPAAEGRKTFETRCSVCHGADGNGGEMGPAIARRIPNLTDAQLKTTIWKGCRDAVCPPIDVSAADLPPLLAFLHSLRPRAVAAVSALSGQGRLTAGGGARREHHLRGLRRSRAADAAGDRDSFIRKLAGGAFREVTSQSIGPTYNGELGGNRFTKRRRSIRAMCRASRRAGCSLCPTRRGCR